MIKRLMTFCLVAVILNGCVQIGGYRVPFFEPDNTPHYKAPAKTHFSKSDLDSRRKSGSYYKSLNSRQNSHLPKGKAYVVRGKRYVPYASANGFEEIGIASWYGPGFHGKKTSNGERFNTNAMTAAHKLLPFGSNILVTNLENGKKCVVHINDRGPFVDDRIIDLSKAAAQKIGMIKNGTAKVHLQFVGGEGSVQYAANEEYGSEDDFFDNLFKEKVEDKAGYTDKDQSVSAVLAGLAAGSAAGYSSDQSMSEIKPVYVNSAQPYSASRQHGYAQDSVPSQNTERHSLKMQEVGQSFGTGQSNMSYYNGVIPQNNAGATQNALNQHIGQNSGQYSSYGANTVIGTLYLHLSVYKDKIMAERLVQELKKRNIPAKVFYDSGFYAVQAGPFQNKDSALQVQQYLKKNFPKAYMVVR